MAFPPLRDRTIWLYYHRLNDQTLMVVNKYVKISEVERDRSD